jgi:DNA-binding LacI/PurR family transcriptional regulator
MKNKYIQICDQLEAAIKNGEYAGRLPGVHRLAEKFEANHITVTKAIKQLASRGLVTVAGPRGTLINELRNNRPSTGIICLVGSFTEYLNNHQSARSLMQLIEADGCKALAFSFNQRHVLCDDNFLSGLMVDGFIFMDSSLTQETAEALRRHSFPFVSMNRFPDNLGISFADFDNAAAIEKALEYFYESGHRRITFLGLSNPFDFHENINRDVYRKVMRRHRIYDQQLWAHDLPARGCSLEQRKKYTAQKARELMALSSPPTAFFVDTPEMAEELLVQLQTMGFAVPDDVSIIVGVEKSFNQNNDFFTTCVWDDKQRTSAAYAIIRKLIDNPEPQVIKQFIERDFVKGKSVSQKPNRKKH